MRVTGEVIQADTGLHIWADRFDGELADIFGLQDQVTASVVTAIEPSLRQAEIDPARRKPNEVSIPSAAPAAPSRSRSS